MLPIRTTTTLALAILGSQAHALDWQLQNDQLRVSGNDSGLTSLRVGTGTAFVLHEGPTSVQTATTTFEAKGKPSKVTKSGNTVTLRYEATEGTLEVQYVLKPEWHFVTRQLRVTFARNSVQRIKAVNNLDLHTDLKVEEAGGASALLLRGSATTSLFVVQQNPFLKFERRAGGLTVGYQPDMDWNPSYGAFESDRVCIGIAPLTGYTTPQLSVPEWTYFQSPQDALSRAFQIDLGELNAVRSCVAAFLEFKTDRSRRVHIPWCENDYQIDLAKPGAADEYKRIIRRAAELGCTDVLYTPQNSNVSQRSDSKDAWGWESLLWLGYGPKIREARWDMTTGDLDPTLVDIQRYARSKGVSLMAYAYPTLPWLQDPSWTAWTKEPLGGYIGADTGVRGFQDWFVDRLATFAKRTDLSGYSFDHWWIAYDGASSKYAQWYGCRRILSELRKQLPDTIIDGRQQYQYFGPWTWVGGTYPHPTANDEQPGSFRANADLHTDRVAGDKQRYTSYWYTVRNFTPVELNPGFITHQTQRNGLQGFTTERFRVKDWDVLGWRYSLLSTIATAPDNLVVNMIPARDIEEFAALSKKDRAWFRSWMNWPDQNRRYVKKCRPILGPPMVGKADGTSMIDKDSGYVFLFNPNYRSTKATFTLDAAIGLTEGKSFELKFIHPTTGVTLKGPNKGLWRFGDQVEIDLPGKAAWVISIEPREILNTLYVAGVTGKAGIYRETLDIRGVTGEVGMEQRGWVKLSPSQPIKNVRVNGITAPFQRHSDGIEFTARFVGARFQPFESAIAFEPTLVQTQVQGSFTIPAWVDEQFARQKKAWPVKYSADDLEATWLGVDRLLLFIHIADPKDTMKVSATIDGKPIVVKKAYNSIYPEVQDRTFLGFYADVTSLPRDVKHTLEVQLPEGLQPGQFQGAYFENIEPEMTTRISTGR